MSELREWIEEAERYGDKTGFVWPYRLADLARTALASDGNTEDSPFCICGKVANHDNAQDPKLPDCRPQTWKERAEHLQGVAIDRRNEASLSLAPSTSEGETNG